MTSPQGLRESLRDWNNQASTFDEEPDHGLKDPALRAAWLQRLVAWFPRPRQRVLDIGCGTGSLSVALAELGHQVTGIDWAPAMVEKARMKAERAGQSATFVVMDAPAPLFPAASFDSVLCRHVLWAMPDPTAALRHWTSLVAPGGQLVLIEGYWHTGAGMRAGQVVAALPPEVKEVTIHSLSGDVALWGAPVNDERYAVIAKRPAGS